MKENDKKKKKKKKPLEKIGIKWDEMRWEMLNKFKASRQNS